MDINGKKEYKIAVIPGDGIGPEIVEEGIKVLQAAAQIENTRSQFTSFPWGADCYLEYGTVVPSGGLKYLMRFILAQQEIRGLSLGLSNIS